MAMLVGWGGQEKKQNTLSAPCRVTLPRRDKDTTDMRNVGMNEDILVKLRQGSKHEGSFTTTGKSGLQVRKNFWR